MATSLEVKLRTAALATPALTALLGTSPFRWYDMQLDQNSTLPAVTIQAISIVNQYSLSVRLVNALCRVQFTIYDTDPERARAVEMAIVVFIDTFNAMNTSSAVSRQANWVVNRRQGSPSQNAQTQPLTFVRSLDAMIWNNETI